MKVYLSFESWDEKLANHIAQKLAEHGHETFLVQRKPYMTAEDEKMVKALIRKSDIVVPLVTKPPTKPYNTEKTAEKLTKSILSKLGKSPKKSLHREEFRREAKRKKDN